jgi:cobalt-zinc-cadmium efflux system protein
MPKQRIILVIVLNSAIIAAEIIFGLLGNSIALVSDALHNLGDVLAIVIALIAIIYTEKKATREMTYGYIRSEMMASFTNSIFLTATMIYILYTSVTRLLSPEPVNGIYMIILASIAFIANSLSVFLLRDFRHAHHNHSEHTCEETQPEDLNLKSAYLHLLGDAGISLGVLLGGILIYFFRWSFIDPIFSILFSLYILYESAKILRKTFFSLMDIAPSNLGSIEKSILSHPEIKSIHDIHISQPSSKEVYFSAHIVLKEENKLEKIESLFEEIREDLKKFNVTHALLQPETEKYHEQDPLCKSHC